MDEIYPLPHPVAPIDPAYYAPDDANISPVSDWKVARIFFATLPFLALHKPFGRMVTLTMDGARVFSTMRDLIARPTSSAVVQTTCALAAIAGTYFMHPIGLCLSTFYDLGFDVSHILYGDGPGRFIAMLSMAQHLLYLGTMFSGSIEVVAASLLFGMANELIRSRKEFSNGRLIEATSHLLLALVRYGQALPYIERVASKHNMGAETARAMAVTAAKVRDATSAVLFRSARFAASPFWKMSEIQVLNRSAQQDSACSPREKMISSVSSAVKTALLFPFGVVGIAAGQALHFTAYLMATTPYIHLKGRLQASEATGDATIFQENVCTGPGGIARIYGGLDLSDEVRIQMIADAIENEDPSLVCLQEVSDIKAAYALYDRLADRYAEFYFGMGFGPSIMRYNSGLFVASKYAVERPEFHSFSDISGTQKMVNKGYFLFSTRFAHFINTHLSPSSDDYNPTEAEIQTRAEEAERILAAAESRTIQDGNSTFLVGDLNTHWGSPEYLASNLFQKADDRYNLGRTEVDAAGATCQTDSMIARNWRHEEVPAPNWILDYFLRLFPGRSSIVSTKKLDDSFNTSDHAPLLTEVTTG